MNELSIVKQFPPEKFNLLGNTMVATKVPDIMAPVAQAVKLSPNPDDGDVYIQDKKNNLLAITKNGLKKLADGAGIKMINSEHVLPTTCQKCAAVNRSAGKVVQCGTCSNKDVAFKVTISVPQLTGEVLYVTDTNEINVDTATAGMSAAQKGQFMKFINQICEAKALNGAIRTALHIRGTYTAADLAKPFVVAYLVPNMDNNEVKQTAINSMFQSSQNLFGASSQMVLEAPVEEEAPEGAIDEFVDGTYTDVSVEEPEEQPQPTQEPAQTEHVDDAPMICEKCGADINEKVFEYSVKKFGRPLCYKCQRS
ncbi:MAG: hypothetical protein J5929_09670 [Eubacterium sp.]|nr:hypothetical protein [Eubacterium sp.]